MGRDRLPRWLARATRHRLGGLALGAAVTAVVQSSSAVTAMVVALVNAGTLSFAASLAVMLGANIGTTATAWMVSFRLTDLGPLLIVVGGLLTLLPFSVRVAGRVVFYLGFILFSLDLVGEAVQPLQSAAWLIDGLALAGTPWLGVVMGAVITLVLQSSSVTTGLAIVLVQQGLLPPEAAVAVVVGANAGTTVTGLIASIPMDAWARRSAQMNLLFNTSGVLMVLPWVDHFARWALSWGGSAEQGVALAHLAFNLGLAAAFLPFTAALARHCAPRKGATQAP